MIRQYWQQAVARCQQEAEPFSLVTVVGTTGSTPREGGSKMVVTEQATFDSIGGGQLELLATNKAREMLLLGKQLQQIHHFPLAAEANQCCGGSVTVLLEIFPRSGIEVVLFGAGHVAQALVGILAELDCHLAWVDHREHLFPQDMPPGVLKVTGQAEDYVAQIPGNACIVIVTHDHALDYRLTREILDNDEFAYLGLIGSATKAKRFRTRLQHDGFDEQAISKVNCPIGLDGLDGKLPMEIAVSVAAQILSITSGQAGMNQLRNTKSRRQGLSWKEIKEAMKT